MILDSIGLVQLAETPPPLNSMHRNGILRTTNGKSEAIIPQDNSQTQYPKTPHLFTMQPSIQADNSRHFATTLPQAALPSAHETL
jgi:hypothetical protein